MAGWVGRRDESNLTATGRWWCNSCPRGHGALKRVPTTAKHESQGVAHERPELLLESSAKTGLSPQLQAPTTVLVLQMARAKASMGWKVNLINCPSKTPP